MRWKWAAIKGRRKVDENVLYNIFAVCNGGKIVGGETLSRCVYESVSMNRLKFNESNTFSLFSFN